jgi:hyperpolarization activated cyclic nucleotide-gated potassium channel 2
MLRAIMTITTIGYGDVSCAGPEQRMFGMVAMIIGALLFGYGVSNVVNIVEELRQDEREFREKLDHFNIYMREQDMPPALQDNIRDFLKNIKRVEDEHMSVDDEMKLLSELSLGLREEVAYAGADHLRWIISILALELEKT